MPTYRKVRISGPDSELYQYDYFVTIEVEQPLTRWQLAVAKRVVDNRYFRGDPRYTRYVHKTPTGWDFLAAVLFVMVSFVLAGCAFTPLWPVSLIGWTLFIPSMYWLNMLLMRRAASRWDRPLEFRVLKL